MTAESDLARVVRASLAAVADPEKAGLMQAYMKSQMPYLGIPSPALKATLRPVLAETTLDEESWDATIRELWDDATHREQRYAATALLRHRHYRELRRQPEVLELCEHLIRTGAWWDHVDEVSHVVGEALLARPGQVRPVLESWAVADDLWVRRASIICQVGARDRLDRDLLTLAIQANLDGSTRTTPALSPYGREFFIRKAIGWALRDHARTDPEWVLAFVAERDQQLSGLSQREALKHVGRAESGPQP